MISPWVAKDAVTPPVVGSVITEIYSKPARLWRSTAALIFPICIRDTRPSCIRAPPDAVKIIKGKRSSVARSIVRVIFSPTTEPMEPIIKVDSIMQTAILRPFKSADPHRTASSKPLLVRFFSIIAS